MRHLIAMLAALATLCYGFGLLASTNPARCGLGAALAFLGIVLVAVVLCTLTTRNA